MAQQWQTFFQQLAQSEAPLSQALITQYGQAFLAEQLAQYITRQGGNSGSFYHDICQAQRYQDPETDPRFWRALVAFNQAGLNPQKSHAVMKFVNIIEQLQQFAGAAVLPERNLKRKRVQRLALAYALTWEHLYYLASGEDESEPSAALFARFGVTLDDHDHDHDHDA